MLGRFIGLVGVSALCVAACGGGAFSSASDGEGDAGEPSGGAGGKSPGTGGKNTAGKGSGGNQTQAGSSSQGGDTSSSGTSSGGNGSSGGVVGVSGTGGGMQGGGMQGGSGGSVVAFMCESPDECPTSNSCHEATCEGGVCDEVHVTDGPFMFQVAGDCKRMDCVDGEEKLVVDSDDSNDNNECTTDSCSQNGVPTHKARFAEVCSNGGGTCNGEGHCVLCNRSLCPAAITCFAPICGNGSCQLAPRPAGDLCPFMSPDPNDQYGQCDGTGVCVDCVNSGACGECCVCLNQTCVES